MVRNFLATVNLIARNGTLPALSAPLPTSP